MPLLTLIAGTGGIGPRSTTGRLRTPDRGAPQWLGLVLSGTADGLALACGVGAFVAGIAYCALFLLLAVVTRNAVVVGLLYALIWESLIGGFVPGAQVLSIQQWALASTQRKLGADAQSLGVSSAVSFGTAVPLLLAVAVGATPYAGHRLRVLLVSSSES